MKIVPSKKQWRTWSLPAKASYVGAVAGVIALVLGLLIPYLNQSGEKSISGVNVNQTSNGSESPNVSGVSGNVTIQNGSVSEDGSKRPSKE